jgi:carbonic anhydrase
MGPLEQTPVHRKLNISRLRRKHKLELEKLTNDDARASRVAELNVQASIEVLRQHPAIKRAMSERGLTLHGLIYDIGAGELKMIDGKGSGQKANGLWSPR